MTLNLKKLHVIRITNSQLLPPLKQSVHYYST